MNILLIGSGGREHAIAWSLYYASSDRNIFIASDDLNKGGISEIATLIDLNVSHHDDVILFCKTNEIDFVIIGPEIPLINGIVDDLEAEGIDVFGPNEDAAQLEGSKNFTKQICEKYNIPTAKYKDFTNPDLAIDYVKNNQLPIVIKADGPASGKGVTIAHTIEEAVEAINNCLKNKIFGDSGNSIIIEEFLEGEEVSFFALSDGDSVLPIGSAKDHKTIGEGGTGPNTGGMGAFSPSSTLTAQMEEDIVDKIIIPTIEGLFSEGIIFRGVLFAGLIITKQGIKLLEYNVRFGDPEAQVLIPRIEGDIFPLLYATATGNLASQTINLKNNATVCVVMANKGYPGKYEKGSIIKGLNDLKDKENVIVFHSGTEINNQGDFVAKGGRVLGVTAIGNNVLEAKEKAYEALSNIEWPESTYRKDIANI